MSLKQRLGKRGFFLKLSTEGLGHLAIHQDPIFLKKKMGGLFLGGMEVLYQMSRPGTRSTPGQEDLL